jgi:hypothetical protein
MRVKIARTSTIAMTAKPAPNAHEQSTSAILDPQQVEQRAIERSRDDRQHVHGHAELVREQTRLLDELHPSGERPESSVGCYALDQGRRGDASTLARGLESLSEALAGEKDHALDLLAIDRTYESQAASERLLTKAIEWHRPGCSPHLS